MPGGRPVGGDIRGVLGDLYRLCEADLLPAGRALAGEGGGCQLGAGGRPQRAGVRTGVTAALVEPNSGDPAVDVSGETNAEFQGAGVGDRRGLRRRGGTEDHTWAGDIDRNGHWRGDVGAVIGCTGLDRDRTEAVDGPGVGPAPAAGRRVPAGTTVDGDLDPADGACAVSRGAGHGQLTAVGDGRAGGRRRDADRRRCVVRGRGGRDHARHQRRRLRAHVRQQVHGRLLHAGVDGRRRAVVDVVQAPGELDRARAEHERAARGAIERQVVRGRTRHDCGPVVLQVLADRAGGRRQLHQTGRAGTVVEILIGLVPDRVGTEPRTHRAPGWRWMCCARNASCRRRPGP